METIPTHATSLRRLGGFFQPLELISLIGGWWMVTRGWLIYVVFKIDVENICWNIFERKVSGNSKWRSHQTFEKCHGFSCSQQEQKSGQENYPNSFQHEMLSYHKVPPPKKKTKDTSLQDLYKFQLQAPDFLGWKGNLFPTSPAASSMLPDPPLEQWPLSCRTLRASLACPKAGKGYLGDPPD